VKWYGTCPDIHDIRLAEKKKRKQLPKRKQTKGGRP